MTFLPHGSWHSVILLYFKNGTDNFVNTLKVFHIMVCFFTEVVTLEFKEASASRKIVKSMSLLLFWFLSSLMVSFSEMIPIHKFKFLQFTTFWTLYSQFVANEKLFCWSINAILL